MKELEKLFESAYKSYKESYEDAPEIELNSLLDNLNEYLDNNCNNEDVTTSEAKSKISNQIAELDGMYANIDAPSDELSEKLYAVQQRLTDLCNYGPESSYHKDLDEDDFSLIGTVEGEEEPAIGQDSEEFNDNEDIPDDDFFEDGYGEDFDFGPEPYEPSPYNGDYSEM